MASIAKFIDTARKEIALNVMEGSLKEGTAVVQLEGLLEVIAVAEDESKSKTLKEELTAVKASVQGTINKFSPSGYISGE